MTFLPRRLWCLPIIALSLFAACSDSEPDFRLPPPAPDPPEVHVGERLFLETRFAEFFFSHSGRQVNVDLVGGDPVMLTSETINAPLPGPFAGRSMNCRACHLVDELGDTSGGGVRTYDDFARHSPVPAREDGLLVTPRNSPPLVDATLARPFGELLHFDGEFESLESLVRGTLTGRNFGWLPGERSVAVAHIANVVRGDDGSDTFAADTDSLPYRVLFAGTDSRISKDSLIPPQYRIDVTKADDEAVLGAVTALISAYVRNLIFIQDSSGNFVNSPYDLFLKKNHLPRQPAAGESDAQYSRRLLAAVEALTSPAFVDPSEAKFQFHRQAFRFGADELAGLKIFFAENDGDSAASASTGNCVACHPAPAFTDFAFHNTGVSQREYDEVHGDGAFAALDVPGLETRNADPSAYLPPSADFPQATGRFRSPASADKPGYTDLGVWNVLGNPSIPGPQSELETALCEFSGLGDGDCDPASLLPQAIALFKTPGVRDLGQSDPYMHNGSLDEIEDVLAHYVTFSQLARQGLVRNASPQLSRIALQQSDLAPLAAFLRALNEDYN